MAKQRTTDERRTRKHRVFRQVLISVCFVLAMIAFLFSAALLISQLRAQAAGQVDVELVFLSDASLSIDDAEIAFQRQGYADAMLHPDVLAAIKRGAIGKIAVSFVEWADVASQDVVVPWMVIDGKASAETFAKLLHLRPRKSYGTNAIGAALAAGQRHIEQNAFDGLRKVIDFSGDSANNWDGIPIEEARASALAAGITINGLPVECPGDDCSGPPVGYDLAEAFKEKIIGGPGSFVVVADKSTRFAEAVRRKLILELASHGTGRPYETSALLQ